MGITFYVLPSALPPLGDGLDCITCATALTPVNYATRPPSPVAEPFHQITCLLNLVPDPRARARLMSLASVSCVHYNLSQPSLRTASEIQGHLDAAPFGFATSVLLLPASPSHLARPDAAHAALRALRASHHVITTTVAVSSNPMEWAGHALTVDGWIKTEKNREGNTAELVFAILATLMSADSLTSVDEAAIADALGSAEYPARVAELLWVASEQRLTWLRPADRDRVSRAHTAIAFPLTTNPLLTSSARMHALLRQLLPFSADLSMSLAATLPALPFFSARAYPVPLLYR